MRFPLLLSVLLLPACRVWPAKDTAAPCVPVAEIPYDGIDQDCDGLDLVDVDDDGYAAIQGGGDDCDDGDASIHPGAPETCDGFDDNCDGAIDETAPTWYADADADGYGDPALPLRGCEAPVGYVLDASDAGDCDDADPDVHPGASEVCDDAIDDDCDGVVDGGCDSSDTGGIATFVEVDLTDVVNRDHTNGPWTGDPSESYDVSPGEHLWTVSDGSVVPFTIIDPKTNGDKSLLATQGGETWRPSYAFPESFDIEVGGVSARRIHVAGMASGWSDPTLFSGVAAVLTVVYADGTTQDIACENGWNMDDWNHTWHAVSSPDAVKVYTDDTFGRHIDAYSADLESTAPIERITILDDGTVHTGTAEKTSLAVFAITLEE